MVQKNLQSAVWEEPGSAPSRASRWPDDNDSETPLKVWLMRLGWMDEDAMEQGMDGCGEGIQHIVQSDPGGTRTYSVDKHQLHAANDRRPGVREHRALRWRWREILG